MTGATGEVVRDVQSHFTAHIFLIPPTSAKISFPIPEFRKKIPVLYIPGLFSSHLQNKGFKYHATKTQKCMRIWEDVLNTIGYFLTARKHALWWETYLD